MLVTSLAKLSTSSFVILDSPLTSFLKFSFNSSKSFVKASLDLSITFILEKSKVGLAN